MSLVTIDLHSSPSSHLTLAPQPSELPCTGAEHPRIHPRHIIR